MSNTNSQSTEQRMPDWYDPYPEPNTMPRKAVLLRRWLAELERLEKQRLVLRGSR